MVIVRSDDQPRIAHPESFRERVVDERFAEQHEWLSARNQWVQSHHHARRIFACQGVRAGRLANPDQVCDLAA
jgi:hypothetical protein